MNITTNSEPPKLDAPGAGLPWLELQVAKLGFHFLNGRMTREKSSALLTRERAAILALAQSCDSETGSKRVLINRLRGMEDSSRYWSVFMTLDHLRIVNSSIAETLRLLRQGKSPKEKANTAAVKPSPDATPGVIDDFEFSCKLIERSAAQLSGLKTTERYDHPWFGPLDAAAWYFLAGFHMGLHRKQIETIIHKLAETPR